MKIFSRCALIILLVLILSGVGARFLIQRKIKSEICAFKYKEYTLSAETVTLAGMNKIRIGNLFLFENADTIATLKDFIASFDILMLLKSKLRIQDPVLKNLSITFTEKKFTNHKDNTKIDTLMASDSPESAENIKQKEPEKTVSPSPSINIKVNKAKAMVTGTMAVGQTQFLNTLNYFPSFIELLRENISFPPDVVILSDVKLFYQGVRYTLNLKADKIKLELENSDR